MAKFFEIPLTPIPQLFTVQLSGIDYNILLTYRDVDEGGWFIDVSDINSAPIVNGIPLVTGTNLIEQYAHLGFGGRMWVQTVNDPNAPPTFLNLGTEAFLYWVTD
jgi:hypothetical protein